MKLTIPECFESADYLVDFSRSQIAQLQTEFTEHLKTAYEIITEIHPKTLTRELKVKRFQPFPIHFRGRTNNIVTDLRNALDQATFAATLFITERESKYANFPFGDSPDDLENSLSRRKAGRCKQIPPELYDTFRRIQPYPTGNGYVGGNDILKLLSKISGPNKHRITLTVAVSATDAMLKTPRGQSGYIHVPPGDGPAPTIMPDGRWNDKAGELVILSLPVGSHTNLQANVSIAVAFGNSPLKQVNTLDFLSATLDAVSNAVDEIRRDAVKIKTI